MAAAQYVIVNGVGYDPWADDVLDANPADGRRVLDVGQLVDVHDGGNPHRWYFPSDVGRVIAEIAADYERLDPKNRAYYEDRREPLPSAPSPGQRPPLRPTEDQVRRAPVPAVPPVSCGAPASGRSARRPPVGLPGARSPGP